MGLFIGLCVGVFILSFIAIICSFAIDEEAKVGVFIYVLTPIILIMCGFSGAVIHKHYTNEQVEGYKMVKITIEDSVANEDLTGLEKLELVKQASERNEWLGKKKYEVKRWYNFYLDKDVLDLEEIKLNKKGE